MFDSWVFLLLSEQSIAADVFKVSNFCLVSVNAHQELCCCAEGQPVHIAATGEHCWDRDPHAAAAAINLPRREQSPRRGQDPLL